MEALTVARRSRFARVGELVTAWGAGSWLLALLVFAGIFAAFSGGATSMPAESRLQVVIAGTGLLCGVGLAAGALRAGRTPLAWTAVVLLSGFALWSALSVTWSAAPDLSWTAANRALAYTVVAAVAIAAASSTRQAARWVAIGLAAASLLVALYALGGKLFPWVHLGFFNLDPGDEFSRVREPIGYWNGVGILCVMATPACIWLATLPEAGERLRVGALVALTLFVLTTAVTYSRGALVAYIAVLAVMVGAGPRRLERLAVGLGAVLAALPSIAVAFGLHDLSAGGLPLHTRSGGGAMLAAVVLPSLGAVALAGRELLRIEGGVRITQRQERMIWRGLLAAVLGVAVIGLGALAVSGRGLGGEISHQVNEFEKPKAGPGNDPSRLISTNGSNRWIWWQEALGAASDKPLAGWGAGSFPVVRNLYTRYNAPVRSTHSVPLQFLSETGIVGAALGLGGLALLGAAGVGRVRRSSGLERSARVVLLAVAAAWAVQSLFDWDWEIPAVTIPALVAAAVAAAPSPPTRERAARPPAPALLAVVAALGAVLMAASAVLPTLSQTKRVEALSDAAEGQGSQQSSSSEAALARKLDPLSVEPLFTEAGLAQGRGNDRRALALLGQAADLQPDNFETWQRLQSLQMAVGDNAAAARSLRHEAATNPFAFASQPGPGDQLYPLEVPPERSPTAFGTPPP